jgi:CysZ protein
LPALLTALLLVGGMVALVVWIDDLAALVTSFADDGADGLRSTVRVAAGVALFAAALVIGLVSFSALTLAVGAPFYELIAEKVEDGLDHGADEVELSGTRLLWLGLRDGLLLVLRSLLFTIPLVVAAMPKRATSNRPSPCFAKPSP